MWIVYIYDKNEKLCWKAAYTYSGELISLVTAEQDFTCYNLQNEDFVYVGWISRYEYQRGFGLVVDLINNEEHFFHISDVGTDLFSCNNNKIKELVLSHLLDELRYSFQKSERFKRL